MNIALFTDVYLPAKNGVVTHVNELKFGLRKRGHTVYVISSRSPGYEDGDPCVLRLPSVKVPFLGKGMEIRQALAPQLMVKNYLSDKHIDVVHTHSEFLMGLSGKKAARHLGIPHVHTLHTMWEDYLHYLMKGKVVTPNMVRRVARAFLGEAQACVAPSVKSANWLRSVLPNVPVRIISNGVDVDKIGALIPSEAEKAAIREGIGVKPDDVLLVFVGRIGQEKRVGELMDTVGEAIHRNPRVRMMFIGDGPVLDSLRQKAREYERPEAFIFTGFMPWESVIKQYAASQLFITLSLSEVQPMTLIEARVCGLPAIVRRDDSYLGLVEDGENGYVVDEDMAAVERILHLADNPAELCRFSRRNLGTAREFSITKTAALMEELYASAIAGYAAVHARK
jgi:1,2-diacylglycerol 3-alpha-glucosyltransferase